MASTRRSPNVGSIYRRTLNAYVFRITGFQRSAQSARNVRAKLRTFAEHVVTCVPSGSACSNSTLEPSVTLDRERLLVAA